MVNLSSKNQLIYFCGFPELKAVQFDTSFVETTYSSYQREYLGLEDGLKISIHTNPANLFIFITSIQDLQRIFSDITFLRRFLPHINRILVCSQFVFDDSLTEEISFDGFLPPDATIPDVLACLEKVQKGMRFVHPDFRRVGSQYSQLPDSLTLHEQKVLQLIASGLQNKQIAEKLFISPHTVKNHKTKLMQKLGLPSTLDLYKYAMQHMQTRRQ
ncbi:response regulator transcription factor [Arundinibacter roseus]|nr:response regulator transcription factor [Arundinibacter roseus]